MLGRRSLRGSAFPGGAWERGRNERLAGPATNTAPAANPKISGNQKLRAIVGKLGISPHEPFPPWSQPSNEALVYLLSRLPVLIGQLVLNGCRARQTGPHGLWHHDL